MKPGLLGVESSYKLEGNVLKVTIMEQYCRIEYPINFISLLNLVTFAAL